MKKLFFIFILTLICNICASQNVFQRIISAPDSNINSQLSVLQLEDSCFLILFMNGIYSINTDTSKVCLVKIDTSGNIVWQKIISSDTTLYAGSIAKASNGFMVSARTSSFFPTYNTALTLINIDFNGDSLWTKTYQPATSANYLKQMSNGDWIVIGERSYAPPASGHYVMRLDSNGNVIYSNNYPAGSNGAVTGLVTSDGGELIFRLQALLTKLDSAGTVIWSTPSYNPYMAYDAVETPDSCYLALNTWAETILFKVNNSGDTLWTRSVGNTQFDINPMSIISLPDGGFAACGYIKNPTHHVLLFRLDSLANILWSKSYLVKNNSYEWGEKLSATYDNGFLIEGLSSDSIQQKISILVIKTDSLGNSECPSSNANLINIPTLPLTASVFNVFKLPFSVFPINNVIHYLNANMIISDSCFSLSSNEFTNEANSIMITPNPFSEKLDITVNNAGQSEIILYDVSSRIILQHKFTNAITINTEQFTNGLYIYEVRNKDCSSRKGKIIKY